MNATIDDSMGELGIRGTSLTLALIHNNHSSYGIFKMRFSQY
jgi:hypothetical protein